MIYISAQPDNQYFIWQLEVLDSNLRELGIINDSIVLLGFKNIPTKEAIDYQEKNKSRVFLINDTRDQETCKYIPSIRPHILAKYFEKCAPKFKDQSVFFHDSDILFREPLKLRVNKNTVYVSDTISYIGGEYIVSKSEELLYRMCAIVGIDADTVKANEENSGGAQYIFPPNFLTSEFWSKVESDSVKLYDLMTKTAGEYTPLSGTPIQAWTADMWAVLWGIWLRGYKTKIHKEMDFSWPHNPINEWNKKKIFHNAGVVDDKGDLFFKGKYTTKSPFDDDFSRINKDKCTIKYVEQIIKCKRYL